MTKDTVYSIRVVTSDPFLQRTVSGEKIATLFLPRWTASRQPTGKFVSSGNNWNSKFPPSVADVWRNSLIDQKKKRKRSIANFHSGEILYVILVPEHARFESVGLPFPSERHLLIRLLRSIFAGAAGHNFPESRNAIFATIFELNMRGGHGRESRGRSSGDKIAGADTKRRRRPRRSRPPDKKLPCAAVRAFPGVTCFGNWQSPRDQRSPRAAASRFARVANPPWRNFEKAPGHRSAHAVR